MQNSINTDILIVGSGVAGLYCALNFPEDKNVLIITKSKAEESDSYLAQGGICVQRNDDDYDAFFEDTMKAGHYEYNPESVDIMIKSSRDVIRDLVDFGVRFEKNEEDFVYTKEGAHSNARILFHKDETGKEITSQLLNTVKSRKNITLRENFCMIDILCNGNVCYGITAIDDLGEYVNVYADYTVLATGGIGGLFEHSTNYRHLTADALAVAIKHNVKLKDIHYIQIHPTSLYSEKEGRKFLISESVRGEGAVLLNVNGERFVNELQARDVVAKAIYEEMAKENSKHVWLSLKSIPEDTIRAHFPNIYERCLKEGYDITKEPIPVVPSQHYFMGGIDVDSFGKTSMNRLYASGETACNGVHGKNRLASNSLLESLVFAKRTALNIRDNYAVHNQSESFFTDASQYENYKEKYKKMILDLIEEERKNHE